MKIRSTLLLIFSLSCLNNISNGAENNNSVSSLIYKGNGQLIADTNFRITKNQLLKFSLVEDKLTKQILDSLKIHPILLENNILFDVVISFTVDEHSCFSNLHIEKSSFKHELMNSGFQFMFGNAILQNSCKFKKDGFKSDKNKCEKYYLPIHFDTSKNDRVIKNGWFYYQIITKGFVKIKD